MKLVRIIAAFVTFFAAVSAFGQMTVTFNYKPGWTLSGNSDESPIRVDEMFGNLSGVPVYVPGVSLDIVSAWKWNSYSQKWQFYTTRLAPQDLAVYAENHGYEVLIYVYSGEGFWVFAESEVTISRVIYPAKTLLGNWSFNGLPSGWNLLASPASLTVQTMSAIFTQGPPSPMSKGLSSANSIWAWNAEQGKWYFYSHNFAQSCLDCLRNFVYQNDFLDFNWEGKRLELDSGFWVEYDPFPGKG